MTRQPAIGVLDLGAASGKLFVLTRAGPSLRLEEVYRFAHDPSSFWQANQVTGGEPRFRRCWDFLRLYEGTLAGLRKIAARGDLELTSLGIDTWGSDGMWISPDGDLLGLVATGRDHRWLQARTEILRQIPARELFFRTGVQSHPFNVLNQIYWYAHHAPRLVEAAATYLSVGGLLTYYLTGRRVAEYTWMSTTQLCSLGKAQYDAELFERLHLPLAKMPPLVLPGERLGPCLLSVAAEVGLKPFEVIVPAAHDTACAYAAAPIAPGRTPLLLSTGTWFLAGVNLPEPRVSDEAFADGFTNEGGLEGTRFLKNIMGFWPAQELRRQWSKQDGQEMSWGDFSAMAARGKPFACVLDINDESFYSPPNMEGAIGDFCRRTGQAPPTDRAQAARAVLEGLAMEVADTARACARISGRAIDEILIVGGAVRNPLLCQWIADASGLAVRTGPADATAAGNALVQAQAIGWTSSLAQGRTALCAASAQSQYQPQGGVETWRRARQRVKENPA